ncbi:MAG: hypothetical protein HY922_03730 [Elusimicrobia bacterium]|nr:hypothetical protein [Elusimicrobiota bacterium]
MRTLIYVPVIHSSADLGSLAMDVTKRGRADFGPEFWAEHERTILAFWDALAEYFGSIDVSGFKIYQDGMIAEGEVAQKIVEDGVKSGSMNYQLVAALLKRGASLIRTEDLSLVKEERDRLLKITRAKTIFTKLLAFMMYKVRKTKLLDKRDEVIAKRIWGTLSEGQTGILFVGAYHNIKPRLPKDIRIIDVKDVAKVREYQQSLPFHHRNKDRFAELASYLASRIS